MRLDLRVAALAVGLVGLWPGAARPLDLEGHGPRIAGELGGDGAGVAVTFGDLTGDGVDELVVGADGCGLGAADGGCVAVFLGGTWPLPERRSLSDADLLVVTAFPGESLGAAVSAGGDLDGDGYGDLVVSAPDYDGAGVAVGRIGVFFGGPTLPPSPVDLTDADVLIWGEDDGGALGRCVDGRRDVDGDGFADLVMGVPGALDLGGDATGGVILWHGASTWPGHLTLEVDGNWSVRGALAGAGFGATCAAVADQNGDGYAELLVGAPWWSGAGGPLEGRALLLDGGAVQVASAADDVRLSSWAGGSALAMLGAAVADPGDLDGDGRGDLVFAAHGADPLGVATGEVYAWFHDGVAAWGVDGDPALAPWVLTGEEAGGWAGATLGTGGDVDGDGSADLLVAATHLDAGGIDGGRVYLLGGGAGPTSLDSADAWWDGTTGQAIADSLAIGDATGSGWPLLALGMVRGGVGLVPEGEVVLVWPLDPDGDGFCEAATCEAGLAPDDCDPLDAAAYPGAAEIPHDGVDQDCDGADLVDADGDGFDGHLSGGTDCDDEDAAVYPSATEITCDGVDQDCDGLDPSDGDGDGFDASACGGDDCDDADATIHPGAPETADGMDQDCDGWLDEGTDLADDDGDGFCEAVDSCSDGALPGDCDDTDASVHPDADEAVNQTDDDCDGEVDEGTVVSDDDGDGVDELAGDCDDGDATVHPGADEIADNGVDDDCDGWIDERPPSPGEDADGDGFCPSDVPCPDGTPIGDCDDADSAVHPGAAEIPYDGVDQDCDGADLVDQDGDGYVAEVVGGSDCDDERVDVHPGRLDLADGVDQDCDGLVDEDAAAFDDSAGGGCQCTTGRRGSAPGLALFGSLLALVLARRRS